ncbi:unnamed protein product [Arabis nemorensis]|uniref:Uncharacterized protein n=1 Tax=Arabis nemorensis TaxID=586526 RepID=A0A565CRZ6_9BRAS|nr:unnamed protein product [Arabis nemorensis]
MGCGLSTLDVEKTYFNELSKVVRASDEAFIEDRWKPEGDRSSVISTERRVWMLMEPYPQRICILSRWWWTVEETREWWVLEQ